MLEGRDIICIASANWEGQVPVNVHHTMKMLSKKNRIIFVESLGLRAPSVQKKYVKKVFKRIAGWFKGFRKVDEGLYVYSPIVIPLYRFKLVRKLNDFILRFSLRRKIKKLNFQNSILWVYLPTGEGLVERLNESVALYHCVDDYSENPKVNKRVILDMEKRLIEKVDLIFTTSKNLFEEKKRLKDEVFYMPNVADFSHFSKKVEVPRDVSDLRRPVIGFVGTLQAYKIDFGLLSAVANRFDSSSIVLVGPIGTGDPTTESELEKIKDLSNIHILGKRDYSELPTYINSFDVCLIPYKLNETTRSVFPMKFFEYLALGKPVVGTDLPALKEFGRYFYISKDEGEFLENVERAVEEDDEQAVSDRIELARKNSWEERVEEESGIILKFLKHKHQ